MSKVKLQELNSALAEKIQTQQRWFDSPSTLDEKERLIWLLGALKLLVGKVETSHKIDKIVSHGSWSRRRRFRYVVHGCRSGAFLYKSGFSLGQERRTKNEIIVNLRNLEC